jgi:undecaprenyl-diphosphatase
LNAYLVAVILGVVEGLTEFLPVSSTAHLRIGQALMGIDLKDHYWTMFSIVIQTGAILSVPIYFHRIIREFVADFPGGPRGDRTLFTHPLTLIVIAFVFTAVPSLLLLKLIGKNLESLRAMAIALVAGGVLMWVVDVLCARPGRPNRTERLDEIGTIQAVWIGICQALSAVFPGTSRSMATISGGQLAGMSRPIALEFSFLLAIPTMLAAGAYDLLRSLRLDPVGNQLGASQLNLHGAILLVIGGAVAFVVAYLSIAWFLHWVRRHGFVTFAIYRILAGALLLLYASRLTV